jgi:hypothetical protein
VRHGAEEYVRGDIHTDTLEGYFSVFKRGMRGTYQHCGKKHLHRYLAEFDFRYNNRIALGVSDTDRARKAVKGISARGSLIGGLTGKPVTRKERAKHFLKWRKKARKQ